MAEWYYQIKARDVGDNGFSRWSWPPVLSGMVEADTKKQARDMVNEDHGHDFPMRVSRKDKTSQFLLHLWEIHEGDKRTRGLFIPRPCKHCGDSFRVIDHYNNPYDDYKGRDFCSEECRDGYKQENLTGSLSRGMISKHPPVIYRIKNLIADKCYIGKTEQAFTLRWWQHFTHGNNTEFHQAIEQSDLTDWEFSIIEIIDWGNKRDDQERSDYIFEREQYWINHFDSIVNGYNTATSKKLPEAMPLFEEVQT